MKIAIEAQRIFRPDKHGMDFVALETIRELQKRNDGNEYYIIVASGKDHCLEESANLSIVEVACPTYPLWEQIALPLAVKRLGADLLHCTSNTAPLCCPVPLVLTLHDIIYLEPRQQRSPSLYQEMGRHYRRLTVPRILKKCRKIITVSHFERNRIREALNIPADRIQNELGKIDKARPVLLVDDDGRRARMASPLLRGTGFKEVYILAGGLNAWRMAKLPFAR